MNAMATASGTNRRKRPLQRTTTAIPPPRRKATIKLGLIVTARPMRKPKSPTKADAAYGFGHATNPVA
jgi:hypothetical protein